jgi:hypothetical protein
MYKARFKKWGFVKNICREDIAKMVQVRHQRAAVGKPTKFERNGKVVKIDQYLKKHGVVWWDHTKPVSPEELPETVRCRTPPPCGLFGTPGPLRLKELMMSCLRHLSPSFAEIKRQADGSYSAGTALWDLPRYLKLACDLFSENRHKQAGSICNSAFNSVHALVNQPRLDTLVNFLVSQLWWANREVTLELWRYLAAYMSNVLRVENELYHLLRALVNHIEGHTYDSYLEYMTACIDDIVTLSANGAGLLWNTENQLVGWCRLIVMDCYFLNGYNAHAERIQARCAAALPRSRIYPQDRALNEQIWRETFTRQVSTAWGSTASSSRHEKFLRLAFRSYAKVLGRLHGSPIMHPSLTRIEGVIGGLSRRNMEPAAITKHQRSFNLESRILSFLTRDLSQGKGKPVDYGSYPV